MSDDQQARNRYAEVLIVFNEKLTNYSNSRKNLQRVFASVAAWPFAKSDPKFGYEELNELFDVFVELESAKLLLMIL